MAKRLVKIMSCGLTKALAGSGNWTAEVERKRGYGAMLKDSNVISLQISTAGIMQ